MEQGTAPHACARCSSEPRHTQQQIYFLRREIANAGFALLGLVLALLVLARIRGWGCLARYHHRPRKGTLASLLNAMIQALFALNAVYALGFIVVAVS